MLEIQQSILKQNGENSMEVILLEGFNTRNKMQATCSTTTVLTIRTFSGTVHI